MTTLSQKNLLQLARKNELDNNVTLAIQNLEEALREGSSQEIVLMLCELYLKDKQEYAAYSLIKEEGDLFSDKTIFTEYSKILKANHFAIEPFEVTNLTKGELAISVEPVSITEQQELMLKFKQLKQPTQYDYQQLFKLSLANFKFFAQSLLVDPTLNFAVRIALCEDFVRLGLKDEISVVILGDLVKFIPADTNLLKDEPIYREVISGIGAKYYHRPSQLPVVLAEVNLILGSLYPMINKYVDEPDSFASDIASYIDNHDGRGNQKLFETIELNLPK